MKKIAILIVALAFSLTTVFALEEGLSVNTLPSGQKVVIKEVKDNPIVIIDTWINTGSINETEKTTGISHFLEHLFFKGTQKYPTGTIEKILDSKINLKTWVKVNKDWQEDEKLLKRFKFN